MSHGDGDYEVIIVGAGIVGASAAHHLINSGVTNILVIDSASEPGEGSGDRKSGSATMRAGVAPRVKMMVQVFAIDSLAFMKHHGIDGARRYMSATKEGLTIQKSLAKSLDNTGDLIKELGSFYVGYQEDEEELRQEFELLTSLGSCCADLQWYDQEKLRGVEGCPANFHCAIFFPADAIIDSSSYAKALLLQSKVKTMLNTRVLNVTDKHEGGGAVVELDGDVVIKAKHVVMATGGLFQIPRLNGLVSPCYSYLVHVPTDGFSYETSSNFFTWGFSHDWCFTNGKVRTSGEDHFSAYKDPKLKERCASLIGWTQQQYGCKEVIDTDSISQQYGVYSDTPDYVPLVGTLRDDSAICYLLGCNAWGQTILSYASSLVTGLLGYQKLSDSQRDSLQLFTVRRFTDLPNR